MRELLIRLIYCEMLGVECPWGYIHAVKMTQSGSIMDKRIGMTSLGDIGGGSVYICDYNKAIEGLGYHIS